MVSEKGWKSIYSLCHGKYCSLYGIYDTISSNLSAFIALKKKERNRKVKFGFNIFIRNIWKNKGFFCSFNVESIRYSIWTIISLIALEICLVIYVQGTNFGEYYLAVPCFSIGFVLFWCFVIKGENDAYNNAKLSTIMSISGDADNTKATERCETNTGIVREIICQKPKERSCINKKHGIDVVDTVECSSLIAGCRYDICSHESNFALANPRADSCSFFKTPCQR